MIRREDSLRYHEGPRPGKIELRGTKPCLDPRDMRLAYLPGAAFPAAEIAADPAAVFRYTARANLVGVITNGSAVPGLGAVGPAGAARSLGFEPQVAMLSFSNFGSVEHPFAEKVRRATAIARRGDPGLAVDGEMQLATARDGALRAEYFPFAGIARDANVLVFPDLQSGNLTLHALQQMGDAVAIGPILTGTRAPAHVLQYGATVGEVVNLATVGVVEAAARRGKEGEPS